jgi:hypothetical protein
LVGCKSNEVFFIEQPSKVQVAQQAAVTRSAASSSVVYTVKVKQMTIRKVVHVVKKFSSVYGT